LISPGVQHPGLITRKRSVRQTVKKDLPRYDFEENFQEQSLRLPKSQRQAIIILLLGSTLIKCRKLVSVSLCFPEGYDIIVRQWRGG
jgi:hypothetical protein